MARLINNETGLYDLIPNDEVLNALRTGKFSFNDNDSFEFSNPMGVRELKKGAEALEAFKDPRYSLMPEIELVEEKLDSEYGGTKGEIAAFMEGAASGASYGISDLALVESGLIKPETLKRHKELNPASYLSGEVVGVVGSAFTPSIALNVGARALGLAGKLGRMAGAGKAIAKFEDVGRIGANVGGNLIEGLGARAQTGLDLISKNKIFQDIAKSGSKATANLYAYEVGRNISEAAIEDKPITAEILQTSPDIFAWGYGVPTALHALKGTGKGAAYIARKVGVAEKVLKAKEKAVGFLKDNLIRLRGNGKEEQFLDAVKSYEAKDELLKGNKYSSLDQIKKEIAKGDLPDDYLSTLSPTELEIISNNNSKLKDFTNFISVIVDKGVETAEKAHEKIKDTVGVIKNIAKRTIEPADLKIPDSVLSSPAAIMGKLSRVRELVGSEVGRLREFIKSTADEYRTWFTKIPVSGYRPIYFKSIPDEIEKTFRKELSVDGKKRFDFLLKEVKKEINSIGDITDKTLNDLRSNLSTESSYGLNGKDKKIFWEMKEHIDNFVIKYYTNEKNRITNGLKDFFRGKDYVNKAVRALKSNEFPPQIKEIIRVNLNQPAGGTKIVFNRINFLKDLKKELNINQQIKDYHQALRHYHYSKIATDVYAKEMDKAVKSAVSWKDIINMKHVMAGLVSKPLGAAYFAIDKALDMQTVKLGALKALYGAESGIYKKIGNSIFNMSENLSKKGIDLKRGAYPFLIDHDSFDKNYKEVLSMEHVDGDNIDYITGLNPVIAESSPEVFAKYIAKHNEIVDFLRSKLPMVEHEPNGEEKEVSNYEKSKFNRYYEAVKNPLTVIDRIEKLTATQEDIEVLKTVYPAMYNVVMGTFTELMPVLKMKNLNYNERIFLTNTFGVVFTNSMMQENVARLQNNFSQPQQQQGQQQSARPKKMGMTQYKGMINRNSTNLQKVNAR